MESLKQFVIDNFVFDRVSRPSEHNFDDQLRRNLDNNLIYYKDCKEFFDLNPQKVMQLSRENGYENDPHLDELDLITNYAREGLVCLVYNHMYGELKDIYDDEQKFSKEEFLANDFEDNCDRIKELTDDLYDFETMKGMIEDYLKEDNFLMVEHLAKAIKGEAKYYIYDWSMGTLETPQEVDNNEDLLDIAINCDLVKED